MVLPGRAARTRSRRSETACEFLLVFDSGDFSENETFLITDWFNHTPREVLAKNFGVASRHSTTSRPTSSTPGTCSPARCRRRWPTTRHRTRQRSRPQSYTWHMHAQEPIKTPGGQMRITDSRNFTVSKTIAAALVEIEPGAMRELHWHPNADEWQYYLRARAG